MSCPKSYILKAAALFLLLMPITASADSIVVDGGLGAFNTAGNEPSGTKFLKIGLQEDVWYNFKQRLNAGLWIDTQGSGRSSSGFGGYQWGFDVSNDVFESSIFAGPTLLTSPDTFLGGVFQFNESLYFGIRDRFDNSIGMSYNHFSSAGIEMPNMGRDFFAVEIKFPF